MKITLAGIGIKSGDISLAALEEAKSGKKVFLRTALSESGKSIASLGVEAESFDKFYLNSKNFDTLSLKIANAVLKEAKEREVVYLVDGDVTEDVSCQIIIDKRKGKDVEIINGVSRANFCAGKAGIGGKTFCNNNLHKS